VKLPNLWSGPRVLAHVIVVLAIALFGWALVASGRSDQFDSAVASGKKPAAPAFSLPVIWSPGRHMRSPLSLGDLRGRPVVINFWASWCGPCRSEIPLLVDAAGKSHGRVSFVGIDVQDLTGDARRFLAKFHVNYLSVRDGGNSTYRGYGLSGVPESFFIDRRGRAIVHVPGVLNGRTLAAGLAAISDSRARAIAGS